MRCQPRGNVAPEIDRESDARAVFEDVVIVGNRRLRIAREEIHLHAGDAEILDLLHLRAPNRRVVHAVARRQRCGIPLARRVVPDEDLHVLRAPVLDELLQPVVTDLPVPGRIHERVLPAHLGGVVDEALLHFHDGVVVA